MPNNPDLAAQLSRSGPSTERTPGELETLTLLSEGKSYSGIAEQLNVSYKTVAEHQLKVAEEAARPQLAFPGRKGDEVACLGGIEPSLTVARQRRRMPKHPGYFGNISRLL